MGEQLKALKIASRTKDQALEKLTFENEKLKVNHGTLVHEVQRHKGELKAAHQRIESYKKAVDLLKANNSKLANQVDDLNAQQQAQQSAQMSQQYDHMNNGNISNMNNGMSQQQQY